MKMTDEDIVDVLNSLFNSVSGLMEDGENNQQEDIMRMTYYVKSLDESWISDRIYNVRQAESLAIRLAEENGVAYEVLASIGHCQKAKTSVFWKDGVDVEDLI